MILAQGQQRLHRSRLMTIASIQAIDYSKLRKRLLADKQILEKSHQLADPRKKK